MMCHRHFIWKLHGLQESKQIHYIIFKSRLSVVCRLSDSCCSHLLQTLLPWPPSALPGLWWGCYCSEYHHGFSNETVFCRTVPYLPSPTCYFFLAWGMRCYLHKCNVHCFFGGGCWLSITRNEKHFKPNKKAHPLCCHLFWHPLLHPFLVFENRELKRWVKVGLANAGIDTAPTCGPRQVPLPDQTAFRCCPVYLAFALQLSSSWRCLAAGECLVLVPGKHRVLKPQQRHHSSVWDCVSSVTIRLDVALGSLVWWLVTLHISRGVETRWSLLSSPTQAILWFYITREFSSEEKHRRVS